jgi:HlyD family secretion protein
VTWASRVFLIAFYVVALILVTLVAVLYFGKIDQTIDGFGIVSPGQRIGVSPQMGGIIEKVFVSEGQSVRANDALFAVHSEEIAVEVQRAGKVLADARSDLETAEDEYDNLTTSKSYELGVILADLNEAEQTMQFHKDSFERTRLLHEQGLATAEEFQRDRLSYESSRSYYEILQARSGILRKQFERQVEERRRNLELAEGAFRLATSRLEKCLVVAPAGGAILTADPDDLVGKAVAKGEPVLAIGCFDSTVFDAEISETDIPDVEPGQKTKVFLNSYPHRQYKVFEGTVDRIAAVPRVSQGRSTFEVRIVIAEPWVEEKDGRRVPLRYGLMGRAELVVKHDVRLFRLILDALRR